MYTQTNLFNDQIEEERSICYENLSEAEKLAIERFKTAAEISEYYYRLPIVVTYSGGKDSDVLLHIAEKSGVDFICQHSVTTVDAPQTCQHVNETFDRLNKKGIKTEKHIPLYKGEKINMWDLIVIKRMPPTRLVRYCCIFFKETTTPNRLICTGVRRAESARRNKRGIFEIRAKTLDDLNTFTLDHVKDVFDDAKSAQSSNSIQDNNKISIYDCTLIEKAKKNKDIICNPILDWTDKMIWQYIKKEKISTNKLYLMGYNRVGCIGCPMGGPQKMEKEFEDFPNAKRHYIDAFQKMINKRKEDGLKCDWSTGEECMNWWLGKSENK